MENWILYATASPSAMNGNSKRHPGWSVDFLIFNESVHYSNGITMGWLAVGWNGWVGLYSSQGENKGRKWTASCSMHLTQFVLVALPLGVKCWSVLTQCLCQCLYVFSFRHSTFRPRSSRDQVKGCWGSNPPCLYCCQHWQLLIPFLDPFPPLSTMTTWHYYLLQILWW